jgi:hypothetical protein
VSEILRQLKDLESLRTTGGVSDAHYQIMYNNLSSSLDTGHKD